MRTLTFISDRFRTATSCTAFTCCYVRPSASLQYSTNPVDISSLSESDRFNRISHLLEQSKVYSSVLQDRLQKEREARELARQEEEKAQEASRDRKDRREAREREKQKNLEKLEEKKNATRGKTRASRRKAVLSKTEVQEMDKSKKSKNFKKIGQPRIITGASMYDYQIHGIEWMASLYENGLNGILADEMGLGKTLQTIAFLSFLIEKQVGGPYLVVVPLSTLNNWENEFRKFAPSIPVVKFYGDKKERAALWKGVRVDYEMRGLKKRGGKDGEFVETFPVVITTYETVVMETRRLQMMTWKYLIVDEGHRIKNVNSLLLKKLKLLDTSNRLLLTGTPLQNNLTELWSLLNFLLPDVFSDLSMFQSWFDEKENGSGDGFGGENRSAELVETLHSILKPFLLRRLKSEVYSNLPDKREYLIYIQMAPLQEALEHRLRRHARTINTKAQKKDRVTPEIVPEPLGKRVRKQIVREDVVDTFDADLGSDDDGYDSNESVDRDLKRQKKEDYEEEEDYEDGSDGEEEEEEEDDEEVGSEVEDEGIRKKKKKHVNSTTSSSLLPPADKAAPLTQLQKDIIEGRVKWVDNKWVPKTEEELAKMEADRALAENLMNEHTMSETAQMADHVPKDILDVINDTKNASTTIPSLQPMHPDAPRHAIKSDPHQMPPKNYYSAPDGNWYPLYLHPLFPKRKQTVTGMTNHVIGSDGFGKPLKESHQKSREQKSREQKSREQKSREQSPSQKLGSCVSTAAKVESRDLTSSFSVKKELDPVDQYMLRLQLLKEKREKEEAEAAAERAKMDPVDAYVDKLRQLQRLSPEDEEETDVETKMEEELRRLREETLNSLDSVEAETETESREMRELRAELLGLKKQEDVKSESETVKKGSFGEDKDSMKKEQVSISSFVKSESEGVTSKNDSESSGVSEPSAVTVTSGMAFEPIYSASQSSEVTHNAPETVQSPFMVSDTTLNPSTLSDTALNPSIVSDTAPKPSASPSVTPTAPKTVVKPSTTSQLSAVPLTTISDSDSDEFASANEDLQESNGKVPPEDLDEEVSEKLKEEVKSEQKVVDSVDEKAAEVVQELSTSVMPSRDLTPEELAPDITEFLSTIAFDKISTSQTLANLRKVANSPYLVKFPWGEEEPVDERIISDSGKMRVFDQLAMELVSRKHKMLVFSQFSGTLDLLTEWCEFRHLPYCMLIGSMGLEERQEMIDAFNEESGPSIFLITTRAGGTGINLTAADSVVIFDSDWNPQQDKQAIDRSHRIGQKKPCVIYRLISTNTMEEMLVRVASDKKRLDEMVIQAGDYSGFSKDANKTVDIDKTFLREIMTGKSDYEAHEGIEKIDDELMETLLDRSDESYKRHRDKTVELPKSIEVIIGSRDEHT
ncbi:YALIA101S02e19702g1_1 [Yarrowia lipolytica]|nr:YALIA101S02e19702g1_1 [Yarrowia lipolytica]